MAIIWRKKWEKVDTSFKIRLCLLLLNMSMTFSKNSHRKCSIVKVFLKISQNSPEKTCARASFLMKLQRNDHGREKPLKVLKVSKNSDGIYEGR